MKVNSLNFNRIDSSNLINKSKNLDKKEDQELMDVCRDFESVFLYMVFKEMKNSIPRDGLIERSQAMDTFEDMYLEELTKEMARGNNGLGLAEEMYENLRKDRQYELVDQPKK